MRKLVKKGFWYINRLAAMDLREIGHRVHERALKQRGRKLQGWDRYALPDGPLPTFPLTLSPETCNDPALLADWDAHFKAAQAGSWEFLGQHWPGRTDSAVWSLDPSSQTSWPQDTYCFNIPFRHVRERGDIKHVWELNRLQYLPPIAALAQATGAQEPRDYCLVQIESWIENNPPFQGVNWASGIELALRSVSLVLTISLLGPETIPDALRSKLRSTFHAHGVWLHRFPSRFSSANNHLIAEAAGLFLLGELCPDLPGAAEWATYGHKTLAREIQLQILADGVGAEQSPTYTAFTLEWMLLALRVAESAEKPFPSIVIDRLTAAAIHLRWMTDEGGNQPNIGDNDEGRVVISRPDSEADYTSSVLTCLGALLNEPKVTPPFTRAHLRETLVTHKTVPCLPGPEGVRLFENGGYTVFRSALSQRTTLLAFDHGPLGYLSIAAHGHADALAVWLHIDDMPVLIDAGTYLYHGGHEDRDYFRGTSAHNTLTLDDENQSRISGPFNWSRKAMARRVNPPKGEGGDTTCAQHDGYMKSHGVRHQRTILAKAAGCFEIEDTLIGTLTQPDSDATVRYMINPALAVSRLTPNRVVLMRGGIPLLEIDIEYVESKDRQSAPLSQVPDLEIAPGTLSQRFGDKEQGTVLAIRQPAIDLLTSSLKTTLRVVPSSGDKPK